MLFIKEKGAYGDRVDDKNLKEVRDGSSGSN